MATWKVGKRKVKAALDAMGALYGDNPPPAPTPVATPEEIALLARKKARLDTMKAIRAEESKEQAAVVLHCEAKEYPFYAVPNGQKRSMWEVMQAKRAGMKAGVPDLVFPYPAQGYHGLYLEMKRKDGGVVSIRQTIWLQMLVEHGYRAVVCYGAESAIKLLDEYFSGYTGYSNIVRDLMQKDAMRIERQYGTKKQKRAHRVDALNALIKKRSRPRKA